MVNDPIPKLVRFAGSQAEMSALTSLASGWNFWSIDEVVKTLERPDCHLFYCPRPDSNSEWGGIIFVCIFSGLAELLYIYVDPNMRAKGVAEAMLRQLLWSLKWDWCVDQLFLEVRISNIPAQKLYEKIDMKRIDLRRRYYSNGEDALIYSIDVGGCAKP